MKSNYVVLPRDTFESLVESSVALVQLTEQYNPDTITIESKDVDRWIESIEAELDDHVVLEKSVAKSLAHDSIVCDNIRNEGIIDVEEYAEQEAYLDKYLEGILL